MTTVPGVAVMRLAEALHEVNPEIQITLRQLYKVLDALLDDPDTRALLAEEIGRRAPAHTSS